jgi:hypothetical protein
MSLRNDLMPLNRVRPFLFSLLTVACLSLIFWARPEATAAAGAGVASGNPSTMPKQCRPGKTSAQNMSWRWKPGTRVRVYYLKNNFNATEAEAFSRAIVNWNRALQEIDSRVVFNIGGERESVIEDDASITIMRGVPAGKHRVGQLKFYSMSNGVMRGLLIISPQVKDAAALTSLMTHEIGHSLGLADCYGCKRGTTAMAAFKDIKKGNEVYEPSECDKYVVAAGYANATTEQARAVLPERD